MNQFGSLLEILKYDYLCGDKYFYPQDINKAYELLTTYKSNPRNISMMLDENFQEVLAFVQHKQPKQVQPSNTFKGRHWHKRQQFEGIKFNTTESYYTRQKQLTIKT